MAEESNELELIKRASNGDRAAFEGLVALHTQQLLTRIQKRIGPELREKLEPEDVLQETFLRAFRSLKDFHWEGERSFQRWLDGISMNFILHSARAHGRKKKYRISREPEATDPSPSRQERRNERFDRLKKSVNDLSPDYRTVIQLSRIEGLKIDEIAERMHRSPSAVRNLLFRAMRQLKESFGDTESLSLPDRQLGENGGDHGNER